MTSKKSSRPDGQAGTELHTAYRDDARRRDVLEVDQAAGTARAVFYRQVRLNKPQNDDSVVSQMARLQGLYASSRWVAGAFDAACQKTEAGWKINRMRISA